MISENKNRILGLDFVRGISVLLMIPVHCMLIYATMDTWETSILGKVIQVVEKGTPMFLVVMGISFAFSSRNSFYIIIKRGLKIASLGYLLNITRFIIPLLLGGIPDSFIAINGLTVGDSYNFTFFFLLGDILQLAGVSLLLMAFINRISKNKYVILSIALLIVYFTKELSGYRPGLPLLDYICDLLWGNQFNVYFSVFPWTSFILIGLFFGKWYKELGNNASIMYTRMWRIGVLFLGIGIGLCTLNYTYHFGDYYHLGPGGFLLLIGINLLLVWFGQVLVSNVRHNKFFELCYFSSKNVTSFYIIQWVLINWGMAIFGYSIQNELSILFIIITITLTTFLLLYLKSVLVGYLKRSKEINIQSSLN